MIKSLSQLTEGRYKISLEESWYYERPEVREPDRHWYERIPCRDGAWIGLFSDGDCPVTRHYASQLAGGIIFQLYIPGQTRAQRLWEKVKAHYPQSCADLNLDSEGIIYFPHDLLLIMAELAGAKRKRRLSPQARRKLAKQGIAALESYRNHNVGSEKSTQI